jgi:hypothetical protein
VSSDPATLAKLSELLAAIRGYDDPRRASEEWKQAYRLLQKSELPADRVGSVVGMRDVEGLAELLDELRDPSVAAVRPEGPSEETCNKALAAFRKRISLTMLDEESKLGRNPLTKGAESGIAGIVPPNEWPEAVWQELARQGKLRYLGYGLYGLPKS